MSSIKSMITGTSFSCNMQNKTHNGIEQTNIKDCICGIANLRQLPGEKHDANTKCLPR